MSYTKAFLFVLLGWILWPAPSKPSTGEPLSDEDLSCRQLMGCGLIVQDDLDLVLSWQDFDELATRLLKEPTAPAEDWRLLLTLHEDRQTPEDWSSRAYQRLHWQMPEDGGGYGLERLDWLNLWRRHNPTQSEAWCRWAEKAEETRGPDVVIAEMESARAADPANRAIYGCLLDALKRAGAEERLQELLDEDQDPDPKLAQHYGFLPEDLRQRYAVADRFYDLEAMVETLEEAHLRQPDDVRLKLRSLEVQTFASDDEADIDISKRLVSLGEGPLAITDRNEICRLLENLDPTSDAESDCWDRLRDQIVEAGLHLSASKSARKPRNQEFNVHDAVFEIRSDLVREAVSRRDSTALERLLIDGPGFGYADLWELALDLAEPSHGDSAKKAEETTALRQGLCSRLGRAVSDGSLDRPIYGALRTCPKRAQALSGRLRECELDAELELFNEIVGSRLSDLPTYSLRRFEAPLEARIAELERRLGEPKLKARELSEVEDVLTDLLTEAGDAGRLIELGQDRLRRSTELDDAMRRWLRSVRRVPGAEVEILTELLPSRPDDRLLRLRLAGELLRRPEPSFDEPRRLLREVLRSPAATGRERAEAHYWLGRLLVMEGRPEEATDHLAELYEARIEHESCPAEFIGCDRDYALHLISVGDWPRLEAYQQHRAAKRAEQLQELYLETGITEGRFGPVALQKMGHRLVPKDRLLEGLFLETECGLPSALAHVEALYRERPNDPKIRNRLERERRRTCVRLEGPFPWSEDASPSDGAFSPSESLLLLSDDYP